MLSGHGESIAQQVVGCLQLVAKGCPDAVSGHLKGMILAAGAGSQ